VVNYVGVNALVAPTVEAKKKPGFWSFLRGRSLFCGVRFPPGRFAIAFLGGDIQAIMSSE